MDVDFLIIGGGIAGISAAAELVALGRVVLLEAEPQLAYHASGRSAALYEPRYGNPAVRELSQASGEGLSSIGGTGVLSPRGTLLVGRAEDHESFAADRAEMMLDEVSPTEACALMPLLDPARVAFAAYHPGAADLDTDLLIQHLIRRIRAGGGELRTHARLFGVERTPAGWRARVEDGAEIAARVIVNAAGAWADRVAAMAGVRPLGIAPKRRSVARLAAPGGRDVSRWPMVFGAGETWYAKPDAGALIVSPAEEDPAEPHDAWADDMVLAEGLARYEEMVIEPVTRPIATWAGLRSFGPDRVPILGFDARERDFLWVAGQGGYGFQTSLAAARLIGDLAAGRAPALAPDLVRALDPARLG